MRKIDGCDMNKFGTLDSIRKTIAIIGDKWWPQTAKQEGDKISKKFVYNTWKNRTSNDRSNVRGVFIRSRNGVLPRTGCVAKCLMTKASNK